MSTSDLSASNCTMAEEIIEASPSLAMRLQEADGVWKTIFITGNIVEYGYDKEDFYSGRMTWAGLVHPDDLPGVLERVGDCERRGVDTVNLVYRVVKADGKTAWVADTTTIVRGPDGGTAHFDCILSDYTETKSYIDKVKDNLRQQEVLNQILQGLHSSNLDKALEIILDSSGVYLDISRVILFEDSRDHLTCRAIHEWCNKGIRSMQEQGDFVLNYARDIPGVARDLADTGMCIIDYGGIPGDSAGEFENEEVIAAAIFAVHVNGEQFGFICFDECRKERRWSGDTVRFLRNIANLVSPVLVRRKNEATIRAMALTDQLTGLSNRHSLETRLDAAIETAKERGQSGYVLFIDLDDFKIINDAYGHDYGDFILKQFADFLRTHFQDRGGVFRFGGDEFVILLEAGQADAIHDIINALLARAQLPWTVIGRSFHCTLSLGAVRFPEASASAAEIVKNADAAMYQAKKAGKNSYAFYSHTLDNDSIARAEIERLMRDGIAAGCAGFDVHYQPIVDMSRNIVGAEALLRWRLPDGRQLPPGQFLPLAEYLGLVVPIGEFVLRRAAAMCRKLGVDRPDFFIAVNISMRQFQQKDFLERLSRIIGEEGADPANIAFEITEGMALHDLQRVKIMCEELRRLGIRVSMDDFGSGHSSLGHLRELLVDVVTIDRSFIAGFAADEYSRAFIRLVTDLMHAIGRKLRVEGVETAVQYKYCRECGADYAQGYYFWRPMPEEDFLKCLA